MTLLYVCVCVSSLGPSGVQEVVNPHLQVWQSDSNEGAGSKKLFLSSAAELIARPRRSRIIAVLQTTTGLLTVCFFFI